MPVCGPIKIRKLEGTLEVRITRELRLRVWLALLFISIGAWIAGLGVRVSGAE